MRSKHHAGFTLVELLIVIVILGILAAVVIARFGGATRETREASLKGNLKTIRASLEAYKANSHSNCYPTVLDDLWDGTALDVDSKTFLERIPIDPFFRKKTVYQVTAAFPLDPSDSVNARDGKISGGGGWAFDSRVGRVCANYHSTIDNSIIGSSPEDTSWGERYNLW
ncbi:MAG: type II secretion system protein [bacterium]|nr:type II secretion system protein [bacterium]